MNQSNSVIQFPTDRIVRYPSVGMDMEKSLIIQKKLMVDQMMQHFMAETGASLMIQGVDISSQEFCDRFALAVEALRSAVYRSVNLVHPYDDKFSEIIDYLNELNSKDDIN